MKKIILNNWPLIAFICTFALDHTFDILKNLGFSALEIDFIKGVGVIVYGKIQIWKNKQKS